MGGGVRGLTEAKVRLAEAAVSAKLSTLHERPLITERFPGKLRPGGIQLSRRGAGQSPATGHWSLKGRASEARAVYLPGNSKQAERFSIGRLMAASTNQIQGRQPHACTRWLTVLAQPEGSTVFSHTRPTGFLRQSCGFLHGAERVAAPAGKPAEKTIAGRAGRRLV